jgi:phenylacetate-CoA ligase
MPLIRYQVGDVAVRGPAQACRCGRALERLGGIHGRDTDVVFTPSGNHLTAHFFAGVLELCPEVATLQVVQEEASSIVVRVVLAREYRPPADWRGRVISALKERGAQELRIDVEVVEDIPRSPSGKRLFVINKLLSEIAIGSRQPRPFGESVI